MIPKEIITRAIEAGWRPKMHIEQRAQIALDPTFWQALGKALGWDEDPDDRDAIWPVWEQHDGKGNFVMLLNDWQNAAFKFYDLIITNQPTEQFWKELLVSPSL